MERGNDWGQQVVLISALDRRRVGTESPAAGLVALGPMLRDVSGRFCGCAVAPVATFRSILG
jgi:hypothetical protein